MILYLGDINSNVSPEYMTIGGTVYLQIGDAYFPEENWYDRVDLIFTHWVSDLHSFFHGSTDSCKLMLWDGPCYARLKRSADCVVTVQCIYDQKTVIGETLIDLDCFIRSIIKAGNQYLRLLHQQSISDTDVIDALRKLREEFRAAGDVGPYNE